MTKTQKIRSTPFLIKDLLFQEKHKLSHTQMDLMAYLLNLPSVAKEIRVDYYVITTKQILLDLPHIQEKTLEATMKFLKDNAFIKSRLIFIPNFAYRVRAIKLTAKAKKYNNSLVVEHFEYEKEILNLKNSIKALEEENIALQKILADNKLLTI
ncbi:hypothetical protein MNB_SV-13-1602 [hydrothermal vent metagenome]|uniref:Uncharacterized protein n=1 Tax=hydrothermal vent metagenome TaxID=652676 RepID=A0A1W1C7R8_9ZZZZ